MRLLPFRYICRLSACRSVRRTSVTAPKHGALVRVVRHVSACQPWCYAFRCTGRCDTCRQARQQDPASHGTMAIAPDTDAARHCCRNDHISEPASEEGIAPMRHQAAHGLRLLRDLPMQYCTGRSSLSTHVPPLPSGQPACMVHLCILLARMRGPEGAPILVGLYRRPPQPPTPAPQRPAVDVCSQQ